MFTKVFHFVALRQNTNNVEHILIRSFVVGFIICQIVSLIPFSISYTIDVIGIVCLSAVTAYLFGKFVRSYHFLSLMDFLKIRDSGNTYLWDDLMDDNYPFKIRLTFSDHVYEGWAHNIESYSNSPHIALGSYIIKDKNGHILQDHRDDNFITIIVDSSKAQHVEIIYDEHSVMCKDIEYLCKLESDTKKPTK